MILGKTISFSLLFAVTALYAGSSVPSRSIPRMPPPGIGIPLEIKSELRRGEIELGHQIRELESVLKDRPTLAALLPDVQIYHNAVRYALEDELFYKPEDFAAARKLLAEGKERARLLREGDP